MALPLKLRGLNITYETFIHTLHTQCAYITQYSSNAYLGITPVVLGRVWNT